MEYQCSASERRQLPRTVASETSALLQPPTRSSTWAEKYRNTHKCVSSKLAPLILVCSFIVELAYGIVYNPAYWFKISQFIDFFDLVLVLYAVPAIVLCFYPLAGYLADTRFSRYKIVVRSCYLIVIMSGIIIFAALVIFCAVQLSSSNRLVIIVIGSIVALVLSFFFTAGFVGFNANVIQLGMDQLHDLPGDHQSLFIHWYVWVYHLGLLLTQLAWNLFIYTLSNSLSTFLVGMIIIGTFNIIFIVIFIVSICLIRKVVLSLPIDPGRINPYELVYRVTKFARLHKVPLNRSAFTYCEDDIPSGLDLGNEKHGGPFTTEQVEDVKVFYDILKLLFSLGPVFLLDIATGPLLYFYVNHASFKNDSSSIFLNQTRYVYVLSGQQGLKRFMIQDGLLSPLLTVLCIPLYICLLRPFIGRYVPGMLKRIGLGIFLMVVSLVCTFILETATHAQYKQLPCMFAFYFESPTPLALPHSHDSLVILIQLFLSSLSNMLIYISLYEFICSQSPHAMKGFIIGLSFVIRGLFETIGAVLVLPFKIDKTTFPSCGMNYYLMNILVGIIALVVYICVARRYKWRQRDEPDNVHHHAVEHYSNNANVYYSNIHLRV